MSGNFFNHYLEKIKNRPPHERELMALLWAGGITLLVVVIWGLNTIYLINAPAPKEITTPDTKPSLWQSLTANVYLVEEGLGVVRDRFRAILTK